MVVCISFPTRKTLTTDTEINVIINRKVCLNRVLPVGLFLPDNGRKSIILNGFFSDEINGSND
jgi:hypothetical protein